MEEAEADNQDDKSSQPPYVQPAVKDEEDQKNSECSQPRDVKPAVKRTNSSKAKKAAREPDLQEAVDKLIINFICDTVQPFSMVEQEAFKELVTTLKPDIKVISKSKVAERIHKAAEDMKKNLTEELSKVKYIASTADCWLAHQKQYLGVTCHWIDEESLERKSASLACKRLRGSQTFDVLGRAIHDVYCEYKIERKVVRTTTDNGSNFIKAFKSFRAQSAAEDEEDEVDEDEDEIDTDEDSGDDEEDEVDEDETDTDADSGDDVSKIGAGLGSLKIGNDEDKKDQDTNLRDDKGSSPQLQLPPRQQCACHLLNLIVTKDLEKLLDRDYLLRYRAVLAKCKCIWNKAQQSHLASEVVEDTYGLKIIAPKAGGWNSTYFAFERIIRLIDEKGEKVFEGMCKKIKVNRLDSEEVEFLREYCAIMGPLVKVSKFFQSEYKIWLGSLLPEIYGLQGKFTSLKKSSKSCKPLINALLDGLRMHFAQMMKDPELAAAAILLPKFKTSWTDGDDEKDVISAGLKYVRQHVGKTELDSYLKSPRRDIEVLHNFPAIKRLFLMLNTALPASAACERLFSIASTVFTSSRIRATSKNLENQLLLKMNKAFRN